MQNRRTKTISLRLRLSSRWLAVLLAAGFVLAGVKSISSTQDVRLSTYYPAPNGLYQQMLTSGNAYLNPNAGNGASNPVNNTIGNYVEIGPAPAGGPQMVQDKYASLVVPSGNVAIGANSMSGIIGGYNLGVQGGLHIGGGVPGGQAQIQLDNVSAPLGQVNRWTNRLEFWASDQLSLGVGPLLPYSNRADALSISNGAMSVNGPIAFDGSAMANSPMTLNGTGGNVPHNCYLATGNATACTGGHGLQNLTCDAWYLSYEAACEECGITIPLVGSIGCGCPPSTSFCENGCYCTCDILSLSCSGWQKGSSSGIHTCVAQVGPEPSCCFDTNVNTTCSWAAWVWAPATCSPGYAPIALGGNCQGSSGGTAAFSSLPGNAPSQSCYGGNFGWGNTPPGFSGSVNNSTNLNTAGYFGCANGEGFGYMGGFFASLPINANSQVMCCQF